MFLGFVMEAANKMSTSARVLSLTEAYAMAYFSAIVLIFYAGAQTSLALMFGRANPPLKMFIEPYLLILGLILHVHWRKIDQSFRHHDLIRPRWMMVADCLSFIITFWAVWVILEACLSNAKVM